jgi:hypothetical protein
MAGAIETEFSLRILLRRWLEGELLADYRLAQRRTVWIASQRLGISRLSCEG